MRGFIKIVGVLAGASLIGGGITADQLVNPYTQNGTKLEISSASALSESGTEKVTVDTTKPKITLEKFNGEIKMGVTYDALEAAGSRPFLSKNVEWRGAKQTMEVVPLDKSALFEDGGYEINILLQERPVSNVFTFSIDGWENLDFFYQPALTDAQTKAGVIRSDTVVGSYAVYYKNHRDHIEGQTNYATGKAYHIFRPKVTDAKGHEVWGDLSYASGVLTVTVPQDFLNTATYPVKVDPTFGYTTQGASHERINQAYAYIGSPYTASTGDKITGYSSFGSGSASSIGIEAYTFSGGIAVTRLTGPDTITGVTGTNQWNTVSGLSESLTGGTKYVVAVGDPFATLYNIWFDSGAGNQADLENVSNFALGSPWVHDSYSTEIISMYATYSIAITGTSLDVGQGGVANFGKGAVLNINP